MERANQRLALDNSADKKQIKTLCAYRDILEARCEELQKSLDDARVQQTIQKEKLRRLSSSKEEIEGGGGGGGVGGKGDGKTNCATVISQTSIENNSEDEEDVINRLSIKNQELKSQMSKDQRKIADLEEEICRRIQDMALLEEELCQREEQVKFLREEIANLEELRFV